MNNDNNIQNQVNTNQSDINTSVQPTVVQNVPNQEQVAPVQNVNNSAVNSIPVAASAEVINNDIPVAAVAEVIDNTIPSPGIPTINEEQIVLDNSQKKSGSNFILIILV